MSEHISLYIKALTRLEDENVISIKPYVKFFTFNKSIYWSTIVKIKPSIVIASVSGRNVPSKLSSFINDSYTYY